jgi:hypothetical protein
MTQALYAHINNKIKKLKKKKKNPTEGTRDWSSEELEEEQEETGVGQAGYSYQPLIQDPEQEKVRLAPVGEGEYVVADIQDQILGTSLARPSITE